MDRKIRTSLREGLAAGQVLRVTSVYGTIWHRRVLRVDNDQVHYQYDISGDWNFETCKTDAFFADLRMIELIRISPSLD